MYNVDAGTLVDFVKRFRLLLGRHRRLERNQNRDDSGEAGDQEWIGD